MSRADGQQLLRAAARYGHLVDDIAATYRNPVNGRPLSGQALLRKLVKGESGGSMTAVSSAGARAAAQFMPGTRQAVLAKTGGKVDPWRSIGEAVHAAAMHLRGDLGHRKGLEGYNPGDPTYTNYILGQRVGPGRRGRSGRAASAPAASGAAPLTTGGGDAGAAVGSGTSMLQLVQQLTAKPAAPMSGSLPAPAVSAAAAMPQGFQQPVSGGGPAPRPDASGLLEAVRTLTGGDAAPGGGRSVAPGGAAAPLPAGPRAPKGSGRVVLDPSADRPGARTKPHVIDFAERISARAGMPVRIGTGTNHSRLTVSGNVSNHWDGDAADVPASGRRLIRLGQAALIEAGADPAWARKQTGGLYNINGAQIIFATDEGGNHHDHLHFRPPPKRKR